MSNRPPFNINLHLGIEYEPTYYDDGQAADVATEFLDALSNVDLPFLRFCCLSKYLVLPH